MLEIFLYLFGEKGKEAGEGGEGGEERELRCPDLGSRVSGGIRYGVLVIGLILEGKQMENGQEKWQ